MMTPRAVLAVCQPVRLAAELKYFVEISTERKNRHLPVTYLCDLLIE
jgi:hypothetical protein